MKSKVIQFNYFILMNPLLFFFFMTVSHAAKINCEHSNFWLIGKNYRQQNIDEIILGLCDYDSGDNLAKRTIGSVRNVFSYQIRIFFYFLKKRKNLKYNEAAFERARKV